MKIPSVTTIKENIKTNINNINKIRKQKYSDIKPIKNYGQYMKEYGLK